MKKIKLIHIGPPILFEIEEFLEQLDSILEAGYKNDKMIKEKVQTVRLIIWPKESSCLSVKYAQKDGWHNNFK